MRKVKMADIAQKVGVSNVTVSKALSDKDGVSEALRARIKGVAQEMGYRRPARGERRTRTVGIVVAGAFFDPDPSCYWAIYQKLVEALKRSGYYSMLEIYQVDDQPHLPGFLHEEKVDGIVVLGYLPGVLLQMLLELDLPIIQMDSYSNQLECVCVTPDNLRASRQLTSELDAIPGIGKTRKKALLTHFKTMEQMRDAEEDLLASLPGMNAQAAAAVYAHFHREGEESASGG